VESLVLSQKSCSIKDVRDGRILHGGWHFSFVRCMELLRGGFEWQFLCSRRNVDLRYAVYPAYWRQRDVSKGPLRSRSRDRLGRFILPVGDCTWDQPDLSPYL